jgi:hypothetical protein
MSGKLIMEFINLSIKLNYGEFKICLYACSFSMDDKTFYWSPSAMVRKTNFAESYIQRCRANLENDPIIDLKGKIITKEPLFYLLPDQTIGEKRKYEIRLPMTHKSPMTHRSSTHDVQVIEPSSTGHTNINNKTLTNKTLTNKEPIKKKIMNQKRKELQEIAGDFYEID